MTGRHLSFALLLSVTALLSTGCVACMRGSCGGCGDACGCAAECGSSCGGRCGCSYAGQRYQGCCDQTCKDFCLRPCVGPDCCGCEPRCGCEPGCACEPACGCEPGCACEPGCGCEPSCGCATGYCDTGCCGGPVCGERCGEGLVRAVGRLCRNVCGPGCTGCDGELYWSEWHNDPPRCCDPCNHCGEWIGPSGYNCPTGDCSTCQPSHGYAQKPHTAPRNQSMPEVARLPEPNGPRLR